MESRRLVPRYHPTLSVLLALYIAAYALVSHTIGSPDLNLKLSTKFSIYFLADTVRCSPCKTYL